jgi:transcriptional regulator with XRE-family HTH domain
MIESIGTKLREVREARNLTLEQVSLALRIRPYHLQALETDDYSAIPSAAQARGFLRNYAEYLGLDVEELLPSVRPPVAEPPPPSSTTPTMQPAVERTAPAPPSKPGGGLLNALRQRLARRAPAAGSELPSAEESAESKPEALQVESAQSVPQPATQPESPGGSAAASQAAVKKKKD